MAQGKNQNPSPDPLALSADAQPDAAKRKSGGTSWLLWLMHPQLSSSLRPTHAQRLEGREGAAHMARPCPRLPLGPVRARRNAFPFRARLPLTLGDFCLLRKEGRGPRGTPKGEGTRSA